ncbi:MAG: NAD(P)H-dependent oxidoreductase [Bacteroidetes Order II. Incertae sedis bacterium]|nr:NAD(P)H-dependent oxidoreductase [Bacteroidetes Order II. bacterium]
MHFLAICGSLRAHSFNRSLLRYAEEVVLHQGWSLDWCDLGGLPLYSEDLEATGLPESVLRYKAQFERADALLIATPEYNHSISAALKNAIEWATRKGNNLDGKPVAVMGTSGGFAGTARAQAHLNQILVHVGAHPLPRPVIQLSFAKQHFDVGGRLINEQTRSLIEKQVSALGAWATRLNPVSVV